MSFDVRAGSSDMLTPVRSYRGDESIDAAAYQGAIFNGYISCVPFLYGAARGYGLDIDADTFERWKRVTAAAGIIDDFLDVSRVSSEAQAQYEQELLAVEQGEDDIEVPIGMSRDIPTVIALLRNSSLALPEQRRIELYGHARGIAQIAVEKAQTTDPYRYRELLSQEADHSGAVLYKTVSDDVASQPRYPRFAAWCTQAIRLGTFADHIVDFEDDFANRRTAMTSPAHVRAVLAMSAMTAAGHLVMPPRNGIATLNAIANRARYSLKPAALFVPRTKPTS